jgi:signal transduction histidine kinase
MSHQSVATRTDTWLRGLNPWIVDVAIGLAFVVVGFAGTTGQGNVPTEDYQPMDALGILLVLGATAPFVLLRRAPLVVLVVAGTSVVALSWLAYNEGVTPIFLYVAAVAVGITCTSRQTVAGAVFMLGAMVALLLVSHTQFDGGTFALNVAIFSSAFMIGVVIRSRRLRIGALEREQEEEARRAVADERLRIARELHDVVAHSMGVIAVQAGAGEHIIDTDPEKAKGALQAITGVSRSTLAEIRRMLGVLRDVDDASAPAPASGLDQLDALAHEMGGAGVEVSVAIEGAPRALPRSLDLNAYRIVQEALTNVLKHSGSDRADVVVRYGPDVITVLVTDEGRGANGRSSTGRHGLVGMRERAALYGGTVQAGTRPGGGFEVAASLPTGDDEL